MPGFSLTGGVVMGFRFRQSIRLAPGLRINLGKRGASLSVGRPGATVNIGKKGVRTTVGVPGSGMSYTFGGKGGAADKAATSWQPSGAAMSTPKWVLFNILFWIAMVMGLVLLIVPQARVFALIMMVSLGAGYVIHYRRRHAAKAEAIALSSALFDASPQALAEADAIAAPRPAPVGRDTVELPEKDNWEVEGPCENRLPLHLDLEIRYVDGAGKWSRRRITTSRISTYFDDVAIDAFCHERHAMRTFLVSRIADMIDLETGEVVDDLEQFFRKKYADSPEGQVAAVLGELDDELVAAMYVARADGRLVKKERDLIADFVSAMSGKELDRDILDREIKRFRPSRRDFALSINSMKTRAEERRRKVINLAEAIIECEKTIDPMEDAAVVKLRATLLSA